jgi:hypothetical protein
MLLTRNHSVSIAQKLNNAWKHSGAGQVWLSVGFEENRILLSVWRWEGICSSASAADLSENGHFGIMGAERAA